MRIRIKKLGKEAYDLTINHNRYLVYYNKIIIHIDRDNNVYLDESYLKISCTTSRLRNKFLDRTSQEIHKRLNDGTYKLKKLNR